MIKTWNFEQKYQNYNKLYERFSTIFFSRIRFLSQFFNQKIEFSGFQ